MSQADRYDELIEFASQPPETDATVAGLARLAAGRPVLELGVGTGRVAIPLAATGVEVHGIDLDPAMADRLREKPGGDAVHVHLGDMAEVGVPGPFGVVCAVFGTLFALPSQAAQVRCVANAAARLAADGVLVIEALMPRSREPGRGSVVAHATDEGAVITVSHSDPLAQTINTRQLVIAAAGVTVNPVHTRYSWPSELDLMAEMAGLRLHERWRDWDGSPYRSVDRRHISIYGR
jgi:SAM-dependent methyltransferase